MNQLLQQASYFVVVIMGFGLSNWIIKKRLDSFEAKLDSKMDNKLCDAYRKEYANSLKSNEQDHGKFYGWLDDLRLRAAKENGHSG